MLASLRRPFLIGVLYQTILNLFVLAFCGMAFRETNNLAHSENFTEFLRSHLMSWDGRHYLEIAQYGYRTEPEYSLQIAWFPAFPFMIRLVADLFRIDWVWAAFLISQGASILGHALFFRWVSLLPFSSKAQWRILVLFMISPISVYFVQIYTEGLFLLTLSLLFLSVQTQRWNFAFWAGLLGALTRPPGVLMAIIPFFESFRAPSGHRLKPALAALGAIAGFGLYLGLNQMKYGSAFYFLGMQAQHWHKGLTDPFSGISHALQSLSTQASLYGRYPTLWVDLFSTLLAPFVLGLYLFFVRPKKVPTSMILWTLALLILIISTQWWMSNFRFIALLLPIYPMIVELTEKRSWIYWMTVLISFIGLCDACLRFAKGAWIY